MAQERIKIDALAEKIAQEVSFKRIFEKLS
jgi:hypothetical protein